MLTFTIRRVLQAALTILGVLTVTFFIVRMSGDPTTLLLSEHASASDIAELRTALGLDKPLYVQYWIFLTNAMMGDLGDSLRQNTSAVGLVLERLPATLELAVTAFVLGFSMAFLAVLAMRLTGRKSLRAVLTWVAFTRQAIPIFFFGLMAIIIFSVWLGWLPSGGRGTLAHLILPALTLATYDFALYLRLLDAAFGSEQGRDYVRTAMAKGQSRVKIILRHMLPNAMLPIITIAGINLGFLLGGTVVTETVFSWPGMGRLVVTAVTQRDYPVIIAGVVVASMLFVVINLIVDLAYGLLDPRVRLS